MIKKELLETIKEINLRLDESFTETRWDKNNRILTACVKISEETWELSWEILKSIWKARKEKLEKFSKNDLDWEFADVILTTLLLAELLDVDINDAIKMKLEKIKDRWGV
jgi:NTP pyrophosphatase (non-canonical NTP hydrolase)